MSASDGNTAKPTASVRELKFHFYDSSRWKPSESFGRIREANIFKIHKSFEGPIATAESIFGNGKKSSRKMRYRKVNSMIHLLRQLRTRCSWRSGRFVSQYIVVNATSSTKHG